MRIFYIQISFLLFILLVSLILSKTKHYEGFNDNVSSLHKNIDAIYYINLEKREDRKKEFLDNFPSVDKSKIIRVAAHYYPDNGAVGCLMSHITALNRSMNEVDGEHILICEDDFTIKDMNYCNKMLDLLFKKIPDWNVVMLGQNTIDSVNTGIETENNEKIIKIKNSQTTSGYLIKKNYIPRLLEIYNRDLMKYMETGKWGNYYVDQSWKVLQATDKWYAFSPTVGVQRKSYSDIQNGYIDLEV